MMAIATGHFMKLFKKEVDLMIESLCLVTELYLMCTTANCATLNNFKCHISRELELESENLKLVMLESRRYSESLCLLMPSVY